MLSEIIREPPGSAAADPRRTLALRANELIEAANAGQLSSFRNRLINGDFSIWQRGTTFAVTGSIVRTADFWKSKRSSGGGGVTVSRQAGFSGAKYCARVQRDSGNSNTENIRFGVQLETAECIPLQGKRLAISFDARIGANYSATSNRLSVAFWTGTGTDEANSLTSTFTGFATPTVNNTSPILTTTAARYTADVTMPANAAEAIMFFNYTPTGTAGAADYFEVTNVQIEVVDDVDMAVTPFEIRPFEVELALCQRYFEKSFDIDVTPAQNIGNITGAAMNFHSSGASGGYLIPVHFKTRKRTAPTVTTYNPGAANANARDETLGGGVSSTSVAQNAENGCRVIGSVSASSANGNLLAVHWTASAEL